MSPQQRVGAGQSAYLCMFSCMRMCACVYVCVYFRGPEALGCSPLEPGPKPHPHARHQRPRGFFRDRVWSWGRGMSRHRVKGDGLGPSGGPWGERRRHGAQTRSATRATTTAQAILPVWSVGHPGCRTAQIVGSPVCVCISLEICICICICTRICAIGTAEYPQGCLVTLGGVKGHPSPLF